MSRRKKKEWINHLLLHGVRISENIIWLQRHSVLRRQLHITDTYTKYLSGSNSVDWPNTNINVGLTWNLCLRSASIQAHVLHLKNLPRLFQKKKKKLIQEPCNDSCSIFVNTERTLGCYSNANTARELQPMEKKHPQICERTPSYCPF